jgi:hypothetical protein
MSQRTSGKAFQDADTPYLSAGAVLVQSNLVAILGRKLAMEFRRAYPIEIRELPFETPVLQSVMSWHRRFDDVTAHRWLRSTIIGTALSVNYQTDEALFYDVVRYEKVSPRSADDRLCHHRGWLCEDRVRHEGRR